MLTLRQLRYLESLARHRHFGRAAEECSVTQPALSMQIQELEQGLELTLVERRRGKIGLTREGEEIVGRARRVLNEVRDIVDYARHCGKGLEGPLRLGVIPSIAPYLLPSVLPVLKERHPKLELSVRETQTGVLLEELLQGALDVLLLALPVTVRGIDTMPLFQDRFLLAIPSGLASKAEPRVSRDFVMGQELLLLEEGHCLRDQALDYCAMARPETMKSFGATSLTTLLQLVANGQGVTLLPELCLPEEARDNRVSLLRFVEPEPAREVGLAWRSNCPRADAFAALGRVIGETRSRGGRQRTSRARPVRV